MNEITFYFNTLLQELSAGRGVVSVTVIDSLGSAPRSAGARMLVGARGRVSGTIGGGPVEYRAEREATELLRARRSGQRHYDLSDRSGAAGMVCGGAITAAFHYIGPERGDVVSLCKNVLEYLKFPGELWLVLELTPKAGNQGDGPEGGDLTTVVSSPDSGGSAAEVFGSDRDTPTTAVSDAVQIAEKQPTFIGIYKNGELFPALEPLSLSRLIAERCGHGQSGVFLSDGRAFYLEAVSADSLVHVFGGGHVARELVPLLSKIGFACAVYDDRKEYLREEDFPDAFGTAAVSFDALLGCLFPASENYFVIMTRGHQFDLQVQAFAMNTPSVYIGVMGSRKKTAILTGRLLEMGFPQDALARVHAPIGLPIRAETPAEIAVSIAAELIQVRREHSDRTTLRRIEKN